MLESISGTDISHVIQLSVAPVFLLAGIGSILGVMANRLARVIDRSRTLEARLPGAEKEVCAYLHFSAALPAALLFITALLSFATALVWFLREIFVATASMRIGTSEAVR